jgi:two-component system NtrC family response regulator
LIVEDDESIRSQMRWALSPDYEVFLAEDRKTALEVFKKEQPPVVALDLGLPPRSNEPVEGFATLAEILGKDHLAKVIVVTGQGEKENAREAIGQGAYDFFTKPIQVDELKVVLGRAFYLAQLERECLAFKEGVGQDSFEGMLGTSPQMQEVFSTIRKIATHDVPVLIVGESGTGKEMAAQAIHRRSSRKDGPFVVINCSAIPETLLESELFGHEKGAFTGAHIRRQGRFEKAQGGTLFLDEIGEISLTLQVKLLRFLQEQKIERVGGREEIFVDTRVLAATNKDLQQALKDGRFREDLYYRLGVVTISLPPLREREGDIQFLAKSFLERYSAENSKVFGFTPQAIQVIGNHVWEGNVRELENRVKRAVVMAKGHRITADDLDLSSIVSGWKSKSLREAKEELERKMIQKALLYHKGNMSKVAEDLGVSRPTLYEMMERTGTKK